MFRESKQWRNKRKQTEGEKRSLGSNTCSPSEVFIDSLLILFDQVLRKQYWIQKEGRPSSKTRWTKNTNRDKYKELGQRSPLFQVLSGSDRLHFEGRDSVKRFCQRQESLYPILLSLFRVQVFSDKDLRFDYRIWRWCIITISLIHLLLSCHLLSCHHIFQPLSHHLWLYHHLIRQCLWRSIK